jgi:hypothetical protein
MLTLLSLLVSPLTWHHHYVFYTLPGFYLLACNWNRRNRTMVAVSALLTIMVLLRTPGSLRFLRPIGTFLTMLLAFRYRKVPPV